MLLATGPIQDTFRNDRIANSKYIHYLIIQTEFCTGILYQGNKAKLRKCVRPLQFNYLSYELFLEKKSCQTPKKKEKKSHLWCLKYKSGFEIFSQTQKKKKKKCKF